MSAKKLSNVRGIRSITFTSRVKSIGKRILLTADWLNSGGAVLFECMNLIPHKTNAKNQFLYYTKSPFLGLQTGRGISVGGSNRLVYGRSLPPWSLLDYVSRLGAITCDNANERVQSVFKLCNHLSKLKPQRMHFNFHYCVTVYSE